MTKSSAVFTIVSKNYLSYARVFTNSFIKFHPNAKVFVLLADRIDGFFDPKKEKFEIIEANKIGIEEWASFSFKYNILEFNTALKPFFFKYLFKKYNFRKIIYFDPDTLVINDLRKLFKILDYYSILLMPHITNPINDGKKPDEIDFLKSGSYNLGFIGLANTPVTKKFLKWWQSRVYDKCLYSVEEGLFVDQKWIDLVPSLFSDYFILRDPGYNVAYWNLHERRVTLDDTESLKRIRVNKKPLYFFHFSGFDPGRPSFVSVHQTRFSLNNNLKYLKGLFERYRDLLYENNYKETKNWSYKYGQFDNGVKVNDIIRRIYLSLDTKEKKKFRDPFSTNSKSSFFNWLQRPKGKKVEKQPYLTNLLFKMYQGRPSLKANFPAILNNSLQRHKFMEWIKFYGRYEFNLDNAFLKPIEKETIREFVPKGFLKSVVHRVLYLPAVQKNKFLVKRLLGSNNFYRLRNFVHSSLWGSSVAHVPIDSNKVNKKKGKRVRKIGLNIAGHVSAESGTGEAVRSLIKATGAVKIPYITNRYEINVYRKKDATFKNFTYYNPYDINLVSINADQADSFYSYFSNRYFQGKYNIGYWLWEQSDFPNEWQDRLQYYDEIWTASSFSQDAISKVATIPVVKVPLVVCCPEKVRYGRKHFRIPGKKFIFLYIFDFLSVFERKNPIALVAAFKKAFSKGDNVLLVLKSVNSKYNNEALGDLKTVCKNASITYLDGYMSREEIFSLLHLCNSYVSLHRSEGYGYTMFEAMYYKKPVIATGYSANTEIMNSSNSYSVDYDLVTLDRDYGPYKKGTMWAEPNIDNAASLMRYVYENPQEAAFVGNKASQSVESQLNEKKIGGLIKKRLQIIKSAF